MNSRQSLRIILASTVLALSAGCAKPDGQVCAAQGLATGTDGFDRCVAERRQQRLDEAEKQARERILEDRNPQIMPQPQMQGMPNMSM